jgi:hypothetical protein
MLVVLADDCFGMEQENLVTQAPVAVCADELRGSESHN